MMQDGAAIPFVDVCEEADLWDGEMQSFDVGDREVLLVNIDGDLYAYHGTCPHQSVSLVEGALDGRVLTCRAHLWQFDVCTGQGINPESACLKRYPIEVVAGRVRVALVDDTGGDTIAALACPGSTDP